MNWVLRFATAEGHPHRMRAHRAQPGSTLLQYEARVLVTVAAVRRNPGGASNLSWPMGTPARSTNAPSMSSKEEDEAKIRVSAGGVPPTKQETSNEHMGPRSSLAEE